MCAISLNSNNILLTCTKYYIVKTILLEVSNMVKCPKCGANVNFFDKRCTKCGQELKSGSRLLIAIVVVVIVVAVIGIFASGVLSNDATVADNVNSSEDSIKETSSSDSSQEDTSSSQDDDASSDTEYWASAQATKFHKPSCEWAQKIKESNKIIYDSREDAIADGREPCGECNP